MSVKVSKMGKKKKWRSGLGDGYVGERISVMDEHGDGVEGGKL